MYEAPDTREARSLETLSQERRTLDCVKSVPKIRLDNDRVMTYSLDYRPQEQRLSLREEASEGDKVTPL